MTIWLLSGEDHFFRENRRKQLVTNCLADTPDSMRAMSHTQWSNPGIDQLTDLLIAQSFALGGTPLAEVIGFSGFKTAIANDAARTALQDALLNTQKNVIFDTPKLDKKLKWVKWLLAQPELVFEPFEPLAFWESDKAVSKLIMWARQQAITLQPAAANQMVDALGTDFFSLSQVLEQAFVLAKGQPIQVEHVTPFIPSSDNLFEALQTWVTQASPKKRWQVLDQVLETDAPQRVIALTQKMLHDYWLVKTLTAEAQTPMEIASWVGKKPGWVSMQLKWLNAVSVQRLTLLKEKTLTTENAIKSGLIESRLGLEMLWAT